MASFSLSGTCARKEIGGGEIKEQGQFCFLHDISFILIVKKDIHLNAEITH